MHIFSPIDLKYTKFQKRLTIFAYGAQPLIIRNFIWGNKINQAGGGGVAKNLNTKFNIHPWPCIYLLIYNPRFFMTNNSFLNVSYIFRPINMNAVKNRQLSKIWTSTTYFQREFYLVRKLKILDENWGRISKKIFDQ